MRRRRGGGGGEGGVGKGEVRGMAMVMDDGKVESGVRGKVS